MIWIARRVDPRVLADASPGDPPDAGLGDVAVYEAQTWQRRPG
jgi:hypothetical protein